MSPDPESAKKHLRSVLLSAGRHGVPISKLQAEFKDLTGSYIDYEQMGHRTLEHFLRKIPDAVRIDVAPSGETICIGVTSTDTAHLTQLIQKQKSSSRRGSRPIGARPITSNYQGFKTASAKKRLDRIRGMKDPERSVRLETTQSKRGNFRNNNRYKNNTDRTDDRYREDAHLERTVIRASRGGGRNEEWVRTISTRSPSRERERERPRSRERPTRKSRRHSPSSSEEEEVVERFAEPSRNVWPPKKQMSNPNMTTLSPQILPTFGRKVEFDFIPPIKDKDTFIRTHLAKQRDNHQDLCRTLQNQWSNLSRKETYERGDLTVALRVDNDNKPARARVIRIRETPKGDFADIVFIDYAESSSVPVDYLREMSEKICRFCPPLAFKMQFNPILIKDLQVVEDILKRERNSGQTMAVIKESKSSSYENSEESAVLLVDIFVNGVPLKKLVDHERSEISGLDPRKPFNNQPSASVLDPDSYCEVVVARCNGPCDLLVYNMERLPELESTENQMGYFYDEGRGKTFKPAQIIAEMVYAVEVETHKWLRGMVVNVVAPNSCLVQLVDTGDQMTVDSSKIRILDKIFCKFPMQTIAISLEGFSNFDDRYTTSPLMLEETEKLLKDQPSFCKIVRKTNKQYEVKMWLMNTGEASDDKSNVLTVNERLLNITKRDCNHNIDTIADGRVAAGNRYRVRVLDISTTKDILMEVFFKVGETLQIAVALLGIQQTNGHDVIGLIESLARGKDLYCDFIYSDNAGKWKVILHDTSTMTDMNINQTILEKNFGHVDSSDWDYVSLGAFN